MRKIYNNEISDFDLKRNFSIKNHSLKLKMNLS